MARPFGNNWLTLGAFVTALTVAGGAAAQPGPGLDETDKPATIASDCDDAELARFVDGGPEAELSDVCRERLRTLRGALEKEENDDKRKDLPAWRSSYDPDSIEAYGFGAYGAGMTAHFDDFHLGTMPGITLPDVLRDRNVRLNGLGWMAGGGARAGYQSDGGFRIGIAVGAYRVGGMELLHDPLADGVDVQLKRSSMLGFQLALGKAFDARVVYPYVDALFMFNVVNADVDVTIADYGYVGTTQLTSFSFGLAPRAGVFVPIDGDFFFDFSAHYGLFGVERGGGQIMFGIWDD